MRAEDERLYRLVRECRRQLRRWPERVAKGYFHLSTTMDGTPVEVMQTYYPALTEYPFFPLRPTDSLGAFDIELVYTFTTDQRLEQIQWHYAYDHLVTNDQQNPVSRAMTATGTLLTFDGDRPFYRPRYEMRRVLDDYRKIALFPYDSIFWASAPTVPLTEQQRQELLAFQAGMRIDFQDADPLDAYDAYTVGNVFWRADQRITHRDSSYFERALMESTPNTYFPIDPVIQLFLNVNPTADTLRFVTNTVLDIFSSRIEEPPRPELDAALNIYFDLYEIQRRALVEELRSKANEEATYDLIYNRYQKRLAAMSRAFWRQVDSGDNRWAMEKYNEQVVAALGINNLARFQLFKYAELPKRRQTTRLETEREPDR